VSLNLVDGALEIAERLKERLKDELTEVKSPKARRVFARVQPLVFRRAIQMAIEDLGFSHLSTITGIDLGGEIEVLYHLAKDDSVELTMGTKIPKEKGSLMTISDIMPNAAFYEREVHEMLGVKFEGLEDESHLLLPDGWPAAVYPLRKDRTFSELHEVRLSKGGD